MDFLELAKNRYSVRRFSNEPVSDEDLNKILEAGRVAPTACNEQPQRVLAVRSEEGLAKIKKCTECHFNAPLVLIVGYMKDEAWVRPFDKKQSGEIDASIVATHMMMEADSIGIGSTWVMFYDPEALRTEFALEDGFKDVALLVMGHRAEEVRPSKLHDKKKEMDQLVSYL